LIKTRAKQVALIAIMAALIEGGKWALMSLPNVEVVSLFCASFGYAFGPLGIIATYIFVTIEVFEWGFNTWVISYYIYWPLIAFIFSLLGRFNNNKKTISTIIICLLTAFFGVLTSAVDTGIFTGTITWEKFSIMYVRGIWYYVVQFTCNLLLFLTVYKPLTDFLVKKIKPKFYDTKDKLSKQEILEKFSENNSNEIKGNNQ
jgi:energy-coupling factor transport system substrate-specific component